MPNYFVNPRAQPNGDHEVHTGDCEHLPADPAYLGNFVTCEEALRRARMLYLRVNGCYRCTPACHTS